LKKHHNFSVLFGLIGLFLLTGIPLCSQQLKNPASLIFNLDLGKTFPSNKDFPDTRLQGSFFTGIGWEHLRTDERWAQELRGPMTGIMLGVTDFGNPEEIGYAITLIPLLELNPFSNRNTRWKLRTGLGFSYLTKQYDPATNPFNRAVSTDFKWAFRSLLYYELLRSGNSIWRVGLGYTHNSNGHTRLPNQGLNSVIGSLEADIGLHKREISANLEQDDNPKTRTLQQYLAVRTGLGQNVLSEIFNDRKEVYTLEVSYGQILNSTFRFGFGVFYRFYEHYYDYIRNEEQLIEELYPYFRENPFGYAANFGIIAGAELLMGHVGASLSLGFNIYKPAYKIDWQLNDGYTYQSGGETIIVLGELDAYYEIKRSIPARLGLNWYFINTNRNPKQNFYLGVHINSNFGQADFTELSLGYVHRFGIKMRPRRK
jgi:hypothetical protein